MNIKYLKNLHDEVEVYKVDHPLGKVKMKDGREMRMDYFRIYSHGKHGYEVYVIIKNSGYGIDGMFDLDRLESIDDDSDIASLKNRIVKACKKFELERKLGNGQEV